MAIATLDIGVVGKYFIVDGRKKQCGHYDYSIENGRVKMWDKATKNQNLFDLPISNVINGATGLAFTNEAALETWLGANFFFIANAGGGGSTIAGTPRFIPKFNAAGTNIDNSIIFQTAADDVWVRKSVAVAAGVSYAFSAWSNTDRAIAASSANNFQTSVAIHNESNNKYWALHVGGSTNQTSAAGAGNGGLGLWCAARYQGGNSNFRAYALICGADGNNYLNPEGTLGENLAGNLGIGWTAYTAMPQRLSVSGGAYFTTGVLVGIGSTGSPHASAIFEAYSTTKGMLMPRVTTIQRLAIGSPAKSLLVFDTDLDCFMFYSNGWRELCDCTDEGGSYAGITGTATLVQGQAWVNTADITPTSKIFISYETRIGVITPCSLSAPVSDFTTGVRFRIFSSDTADVSIVNWLIIN